MITQDPIQREMAACDGGGLLAEPADPRMATWVAFLQAHAAVTRRLEAELMSERRLSLAEYDALLQLAVADDRRLRMSELADRVVLSRSGMTRLVDRLEASGMIERRACANDARVLWATLTERGLEQLRDAMPVHLRGVEKHFLAAIPDADRDALLHALEAVVGKLRGSSAVAACETAARFEAGARPITPTAEAIPVGSPSAVAAPNFAASAVPGA